MYDPDAKNAVLNLWGNYTARQISDLVAEKGYDISHEQVRNIVRGAKGDPRAIRKTNAVYG